MYMYKERKKETGGKERGARGVRAACGVCRRKRGEGGIIHTRRLNVKKKKEGRE